MRRLIFAIALFAILIAPACRTKRKPRLVVEEDAGSQVASVITMSDPRAASQLVRGFYGVENGAWRWVMKRFTVTVHPPTGADQNGAKLELKFAIPDVTFSQIHEQTISAQVNGVDLPAQKYTKAGDAVYSQEVPASALHGDLISIDFTADKALPPGGQDARELAIVVTSVGLLPK